MNWDDEPREVTLAVRAQVRGRRYTRVPLRKVAISIYGIMWPHETSDETRFSQERAESITWICTVADGGKAKKADADSDSDGDDDDDDEPCVAGVWWFNYVGGGMSNPR